ncbi:hypothetical protein CTAYLR_004565 [Chrysophaeum taylorii]|uniref:CCDC113/CCDC96 coiled-coil domain-containing protein n=1 Tax=Chrysophaeum taylorii TaxID=2483200 RepID=A0AAD7XKP7_9STRA|nr:hypothetical protein CTAYLR_004565 [Chrysophaeum taylorii]
MDEEVLRFCLEQVNASRSGKGLELDPVACELAQRHAQTMVEEGILGHVGPDGATPYQRYGLAGYRHHVRESVWGKDGEFGGVDLKELAAEARAGIRARGESKPASSIELATHAGFGVSRTARQFRYVEVIVTKAVELDAVSCPDTLMVPELTLSGTMTRRGAGPFCALAYYDPPPSSGTNDDEEALFYDDFGSERLAVAWPWDFVFEDGAFSTKLRLEPLRPGTYYVQLFVRGDPESIPYAGEVEGVELPGPASAPATGLVLVVVDDAADAAAAADESESESESTMVSSLSERAARSAARAAAREPDGAPLTAVVVVEKGLAPPEGFERKFFGPDDDDVDGGGGGFSLAFKRINIEEFDLAGEEREARVVVDVTVEPEVVTEDYECLDPETRLYARFAPAAEAVGFNAVVDLVVVRGASPHFTLGGGYEQVRVPAAAADGTSFFVCLKREGAGRSAYEEQQRGKIAAVTAAADEDELLDTTLTPEEVRARETERAKEARDAEKKLESEEREREETRKEEKQKEEVQRLLAEKDELLATNADLQRKLAAIMTTTTSKKDDASSSHEAEKQYSDALAAILETKQKAERMQAEADRQTFELQSKLDEKEYTAKKIAESFREFKREIATNAEHSRTGKPIPPRIIKQFEELEMKREAEVEKVRLKHINLRMTLRKLEQTLRAKEQLAEGLHLIDFEQLKIENQTLCEKIEERNDELAKLKKKNAANVQVLTHVKEKLQHVLAHNQKKRAHLADLDKQLAAARDNLTKAKAERDALRARNAKLKQRQGFANSALLVQDFERRKRSPTSRSATRS